MSEAHRHGLINDLRTVSKFQRYSIASEQRDSMPSCEMGMAGTKVIVFRVCRVTGVRRVHCFFGAR
jgi:hypothetical protein